MMTMHSNSSYSTNERAVVFEHNMSILHGCDGEIGQSIDQSESLFLVFTFFFIATVSVFGNIVVVTAILKNNKLRIPKNFLLCSLAFTDMLSPLERLVPTAISSLYGSWVFGCTWCKISSAGGVFFCSSSILHLCAITVERHISINCSIRTRNAYITKRNVSVLLAIIWLLALAMALIPYINSSVKFHFNSMLLFCEVYLVTRPYLSLLMGFVYFVLPLVLMTIIYWRIYQKTAASSRRISHYQDETAQVGGQQKMKQKMTNQEWKTAKMVMTVIGLFFLLWLPYFGVMVLKSYLPNRVDGWVERCAVVCAYLNSCANFFVYSIMNSNMRMAFKQLFPCFSTSHDIIKHASRTISSVKLPACISSQRDCEERVMKNMEIENTAGEGFDVGNTKTKRVTILEKN